MFSRGLRSYATKLIAGGAIALAGVSQAANPIITSIYTADPSARVWADGRLYLYLFDLLHLNGWDLRPCGLTDRKRVLQGLAGWGGMLRYSDHQLGQAANMLREACRLGLEGIVCKQVDAPYRAGRGHDWLKVKCQHREEFVVLGWPDPEGRRPYLGALLLAYYDPEGRLVYAGRVGTGIAASARPCC